jgi:8-oxo-dGTP diphosphatase
MKAALPAKHYIVVNVLVFDQAGRVLVFKRKDDPFKDKYALPGGAVHKDELLADAAKRKLKELTGIEAITLRFVGLYDALDRDPRARVIATAFLAALWRGEPRAGAGTDGVFWVEGDADLAFDHAQILAEQQMFKQLSKKVPAFELLRPGNA